MPLGMIYFAWFWESDFYCRRGSDLVGWFGCVYESVAMVWSNALFWFDFHEFG